MPPSISLEKEVKPFIVIVTKLGRNQERNKHVIMSFSMLVVISIPFKARIHHEHDPAVCLTW
jgi:hypothetical protein